MACKCGSERIASVSAKCSDCCCVKYSPEDEYKDGYVPSDMGIGGGDYVEFEWCLDCGLIQGDFPVQTETNEES